MNVLSTRYAGVLLVILVLAAIPIVASTVAPRRVDDCANPAAMADLSGMPWKGEFATPRERRDPKHPQWTTGVLESQTARERRERLGDSMGRASERRRWWRVPQGGAETETLNVRIVRSFDPFFLRQRATSLLGVTLIPDHREVRTLATPYGDLVVHAVQKYAARQSQFVAYAYIYDGRSVEVPLFAEMAALPELLMGGARPLTVLLVQVIREHGTLEPAEGEAMAWLEAAWDHYQQACFPDRSFGARADGGSALVVGEAVRP